MGNKRTHSPPLSTRLASHDAHKNLPSVKQNTATGTPPQAQADTMGGGRVWARCVEGARGRGTKQPVPAFFVCVFSPLCGPRKTRALSFFCAHTRQPSSPALLPPWPRPPPRTRKPSSRSPLCTAPSPPRPAPRPPTGRPPPSRAATAAATPGPTRLERWRRSPWAGLTWRGACWPLWGTLSAPTATAGAASREPATRGRGRGGCASASWMNR